MFLFCSYGVKDTLVVRFGMCFVKVDKFTFGHFFRISRNEMPVPA
jgi:hypothetical protein